MAPYSNPGTASPSTTPAANQHHPPPRSTSSAAPDQGPNSASAQHKRVYQACIPCRRRKVRCDLGSVDNPHDPPCVRCRRESKECFFSATRRKRKADDGEVSDHDEYIIRNGRKRLNNSGASESRTPPPAEVDERSRLYSDAPLTPGGSLGRTQPLRRPDDHNTRHNSHNDSNSRDHGGPNHNDHDHADANQQLENVEAQTVMRRGLYGPHDALDLLYKAATDRSVASEFSKTRANAQQAATTPPLPSQQQQQLQQQYQQSRPGIQQPQHHMRHGSRSSAAAAANGSDDSFRKPVARSSSFGVSSTNDSRDGGPRVKREMQRHVSDAGVKLPHVQAQPGDEQQPIDPELDQEDLSSQPGYVEALRAWTRFRFVRAGWFTPQEAIEYIDYYYKFLSPMTPISPPTFSDPASHLTLLTEEPILAVTLLTIASRYKKLDGPGGHCRSSTIHEQLWTYLRGMIERCLWGQEAFGSGFCGSGSSAMIEEATQTSSTAPWRGMRVGSLRTLGTIESLMILTEWHPRALHFPPQDATDELMLPDFERLHAAASPPGEDGAASKPNGASFGGRRIESWLEPAWRSDRMCWMLLSTGMGLAYELGVFDNMEEILKEEGANRPEFQDDAYRARANRIKRLLLIYTTQLAGRLGWTSMCPDEVRRNDPAFSKHASGNNSKPQRQQHSQQAHAGGVNNDEPTPGTTFSSLSNHFNYIPDMALDDQIIHCWAGISHAMHMGNEKLFRSRRHTQEIIQSGKYVSLLGDFGPMLKAWETEFELFRLPPFIRCILKIEYEYVRIYVNSLSLQAVVERCTNNATGATVSHGGDGDQAQQQQQQAQHQQAPAQQPQDQPGAGPTQLSPQTIMNYGKLPLGQLGGFTVHDQEYVREVVEGSRNLLNEVVTGLLPHGYLKHAPVRTYFRIISGAMFLLKTFALGAPRSDVKASIDLMDSTVEALRNCVVDDVHLGIRFADLLESLTSRLRNRFIQAPTLQQATSGRGQSPVAGADANGANGVVAGDWIGGHAQSLRDGLNGQFRPPSPTMEGNNISATPFDLTSATFPYPGGASLGPGTPAAALELSHNANPNNHTPAATAPPSVAPTNGIDATLFDEWNNPGNEMWYLPPGPAFFQNVGVGGDSSAVAMTSEGVNVGGLDLLDYMGMDSSQFGGGDMGF